jgi:predicted aldo/keto reductase-like oxidoreductase
MNYRRFGRLDWRVSALGFGCMRLPIIGDDHANIDEPEATRMVRYTIDGGVNYIDTAYPYHGGNSERFVGRVLQDGYREKVRLATKLRADFVETADDFDRIFDEQMERLETEYVDFYLMHGLSKDRWHRLRDMGVMKWAEGVRAEGRIKHLGFSFHDTYDTFKEIIDAYDDWTLCQIQYNYMDVDEQAGVRGLKYAASKGLAVVVMEPIRGGRLASPPEAVQALWDTASTKRAPADWALQWVWNQPEVSVVLSGMSTMQQVEENVASASVALPNTLTEEELSLISRVREKYQELCPVPCTQCRYCMPCPNGVNIPRNFAIFNEGRMYNQIDDARQAYEQWLPEDERASACVQCRQCEELCPQAILISEWMPDVHGVLGEGQPYGACRMLGRE